MEGLLQRILGDKEENRDSENTEEEVVSDASTEVSATSSAEWSAPIMEVGQHNTLCFEPQTKEQEPPIPNPAPDIREQGIKCQRLGEPSWNKIRYIEAQKKLQAGGVFTQLQTNHQLAQLNHRNPTSDLLAKLDNSFGILTHGLLLQRKHFQEVIREMTVKYPETGEYIKRGLIEPTSGFRSVSDDLLQYVCGKGSEVLEARRNLHRISIPMMHIPPSDTHLFDEKQLTEFLSQQPSSSLRAYGHRYRKLSNYNEKRFRNTVQSKQSVRQKRNGSASRTKTREDKSTNYKREKKSDKKRDKHAYRRRF